MRILLLALLLPLGACSAAREAAGQIQSVADRGIGIGSSSQAEAAGATAPDAPAAEKPAALPAGLGGDKEHPPYAPPPPR